MITKSLLKKCFVILMFLGIIGLTNLNAQEFTVGDLNYRINDDGASVTVTGHINGWAATGELDIPESVEYDGNNYPVTIIGDGAFYSCDNLTGSLIIPDGVIIIGQGAFSACRGFNGTLFIPGSVTQIDEMSTFCMCDGFTNVVIDESNPIYDSRDNCNAIVETNTNTIICGFPCTTVTNTITCIGVNAFFMSGLTHINIQNGVQIIETNAFQACSALVDIYIPSSVNYIGSNAFPYCNSLEEIVVDPANPVYDSRNNCNAIIKTENDELISGCKNTIMPNDIISIGDRAFAGCGLAGTLTIPQSVVSIGYDAFQYCPDLTGSLVIPNSVVEIGESAFAECFGFTDTLTIGNSVERIGSAAFKSCNGFTGAVSLATIPPALDGDDWESYVFLYFGCNTLTVPCGCSAAYQNSSWYNPYEIVAFSAFVEDCSAVLELNENLASVYPNPTNSIVKIEAENIQNVSIYNMMGEMVFESSTSGNEFEYDFSNHESGVYLIRIETVKGVVTKRVTVM